MEPSWNLTFGPPRSTPEPIWAETPKISAVGENRKERKPTPPAAKKQSSLQEQQTKPYPNPPWIKFSLAQRALEAKGDRLVAPSTKKRSQKGGNKTKQKVQGIKNSVAPLKLDTKKTTTRRPSADSLRGSQSTIRSAQAEDLTWSAAPLGPASRQKPRSRLVLGSVDFFGWSGRLVWGRLVLVWFWFWFWFGFGLVLVFGLGVAWGSQGEATHNIKVLQI